MSTKSNRPNVLTFTLSSLLGLAAAIGIGGGAQAAESPSITVSYRDLDLSRPADVQVLYHRLGKAAASVCMVEPAEWDLSRHLAWSRCYYSVLDSAVTEVRSPELLALYRASRSSGA
jgi:UrcA family protein